MSLSIVILAAGQGTRMRSKLPKVMHPLAGKPLLGWVVDTAAQLGAKQILVVHGHGADQVREAFSERPLIWVLQSEQRGTGHAVQQAAEQLDPQAQVLVLYGDVPLITTATLNRLLTESAGGMGLLTIDLPDPSGYGRILRDAQGKINRIVEHKDATPEELGVTEVNTGILCLPARHLLAWLPKLQNNNAQGEYYLTDLIALAVAEKVDIVAVQPTDAQEVAGVNTRAQLAELERYYQRQQARKLMDGGVSLADPDRFDLRGHATVASDVSIDVNVILEGEVTIESGVRIEANCIIRDSHIGAGAKILANSVLESARVGAGASVGPFARLRPGAELAEKSRVGNFVEIKNASIGFGSKVNHLSYIGDARLGAGVNIGAGTITANYDGKHKHHTEIGDGASTGANSVMVAPVELGPDVYVGAGSVITKNVPAGNLAIGRGRQRNIERSKESE
jgi:bifunctional UDP-N-acetylglucosamine pyrophosphorylase / glucosamine-1-phosphate N-acetyltransferase